MTAQNMSDDELKQARGQHVTEITELNQQIGAAERRAKRNALPLERKRDTEMRLLRVIDDEFERRGI